MDYRRIAYIGIVIISLGIIFSTTLSDKVGSLGTVFIAIGCLFLISAMARKRKEQVKEEGDI